MRNKNNRHWQLHKIFCMFVCVRWLDVLTMCLHWTVSLGICWQHCYRYKNYIFEKKNSWQFDEKNWNKMSWNIFLIWINERKFFFFRKKRNLFRFFIKKNTKTSLNLPQVFCSTQHVLKVFKSGTTKQWPNFDRSCICMNIAYSLKQQEKAFIRNLWFFI